MTLLKLISLYGSVLSLVILWFIGVLFFYKNKLKFHVRWDLDKIKFRLKENFQFFMSSVAGHIFQFTVE